MLPRIIVVNTDSSKLRLMADMLRSHFEVFPYTEPERALEFARSRNCHIAMASEDIKVANFLGKFAVISPHSKRCLMTENIDESINVNSVDGIGIDCLLSYSLNEKELIIRLNNLVREYVTAIRKKKYYLKLKQGNETSLATHHNTQRNIDSNELLKELEVAGNSNKQLLKLIINIVSLYGDTDSHHCHRIAEQARYFMLDKGYSSEQGHCAYLASHLYKIAAIQLPTALFDTPYYELKINEKKQWLSLFAESADMLRSVDALSNVAALIELLFRKECSHDSGEEHEDWQCFAAKLLTHLIAIDLLIQGKVKQERLTPFQAFALLGEFIPGDYDAVLAKYILNSFLRPGEVPCEVPVHVADLKVGMVIAEDYYNESNHKLVGQNRALTQQMLEGLLSYQENVSFSVIVYIKGGFG